MCPPYINMVPPFRIKQTMDDTIKFTNNHKNDIIIITINKKMDSNTPSVNPPFPFEAENSRRARLPSPKKNHKKSIVQG